jgi:acyl-CoA thioester hydrolase
MYFEFHHNFYNAEGKNMARCNMMGGWIDLKTRKLRDLPESLISAISNLDKTEDFKMLTKEDTRKFKQFPKDLS